MHVPIRVSTLRGDQKIDFDVYIKINDKHILYLRQGDSFEGVRLQRLRDKKLKKLFILTEQEDKYRKYLTLNLDTAYDLKSNMNLENRAEILQGAQQTNAEEVMENPGSVENYNDTKKAVSRFVEFLQKEQKALGHILKIENVDANIAHHGVNVSTLAIALAQKIGVTAPAQTQLLSMGALLHDFEHFHSGLAINRPLSAFSPEELELYKKHPLNGSQKVQDKKHFDQTVINIITQHEEFIDGKGFPQGLSENKLDPLAVIVSTCNALDRLISFEGVPAAEAAKKLVMTGVGKYPLNQIQFLGEALKSLQAP